MATGTPVAYLTHDTNGVYKLNNTDGTTPLSVVDSQNRYVLQGSAGSYKLIEGNYYFVETTTPDRCEVDTAQHAFAVDGLGTIYLKNNGGDKTSANRFTNNFIRGEVVLRKVDSIPVSTGPDVYAPVHGAVFDVHLDDGSDLLVGYLVESGNTGTYILSTANGSGGTSTAADILGRPYVKDGKLAKGNYYFIESVTPAGYLPDAVSGVPNVHKFSVTTEDKLYLSDAATGAATMDSAAQFANVGVTADVELYKVDSVKDVNTQDIVVSGAGFTVYESAGDTPVAYMVESGSGTGKYILRNTPAGGGSALNAVTADGVPYLRNGKLIYGNYYVEETTVPDGYIAQKTGNVNTKFSFSVGADGATVYITNAGGVAALDTFANDYISAPVQLTKVDNEGKRLADAGFTVYTDTGHPTTAAADTPVAFLKHTSGGVYKLDKTGGTGETATLTAADAEKRAYLQGAVGSYKLIYGTYYYVETTTPAGCAPDNTGTDATQTKHYFTVSATGAIYLKNTGGNGDDTNEFTNEFVRADVQLKKRDSLPISTGPDVYAPVHGAEFAVYLVDGSVDPSTDTQVAYLVEDGVTGTYKLSATDKGGLNLLTPAAEDSLGRAYLSGGKLAHGDYYFVESVTPTGYLPDETGGDAIIHKFSLRATDTLYLSNDRRWRPARMA